MDGYEEWLKHNPAPDLHELIRRYGDYGQIPPAAWAGYDRAMARWEERRKRR